MAGQYGGGNQSNLQAFQQVQKYLDTHDIASAGFGSWAADGTRFVDVGPEIGALLGIPAKNIQNGTYSVSLQDLAGLTLMASDPKSGLNPNQHKGVDKLMETIGGYAGSAGAYDYYKKSPSLLNAKALINSAMTGNYGLTKLAYTSAPSTAYSVASWAKDYPVSSSAGGYGPNGDWTYSQMRQYDSVSNFLSYWPQLDSPQTQRELTKAVSLGMTANQIQRALYDPSTDTSGVLAGTSRKFGQAFPALVNAYKTGTPIAVDSPEAYQRLSADYQRVYSQYGLGNLSNDQIANLITNHVTPDDLTGRAQMAVSSYTNAPQSVKDTLNSQYGITPQMAIRHILDPKTNIQQIKQELSGASLLAAGARSGITKQDATTLTNLAESPTAGVSQQDVMNAVQKANELSYLQQPTVGKIPGTQTTASAQDVLGATVQGFSPDQVAEQEKINKALQERQQASMAGGQIIADQSGVKGAGQIQ